MSEKFETITEAQIGFALKLLQSQHKDDKSTVFSPVSISLALATIYLGSQGDTEEQIRNALAEGFDKSSILTYFTKLMKHIKKKYSVKEARATPENDDSDEEEIFLPDHHRYACVLETFNRAYINEDIKLKDNFVKKCDEFCQDGIEKVNFTKAAGVAVVCLLKKVEPLMLYLQLVALFFELVLKRKEERMKINNFISEVTRNKIKNIVTENSFNEMSKIILINAIYFKARWDHEFSKSATKDADFFMAPGIVKKAKMMYQRPRKWQYSENDEFQFLTLGYQCSNLSMRIILPKKRYGLADVIKSLTVTELIKHLTKYEVAEVIVKMPRFEIKTEFNATETLKSMGIKDLFESNANLEEMSDDKPISISSILHNAYIKTDEKGTEAAAVTTLLLVGSCAGRQPPPPPIEFTADHPFMYLITDDENNNIYFCGVVSGAEFKDSKGGKTESEPKRRKISENPVPDFSMKLRERKP